MSSSNGMINPNIWKNWRKKKTNVPNISKPPTSMVYHGLLWFLAVVTMVYFLFYDGLCWVYSPIMCIRRNWREELGWHHVKSHDIPCWPQVLPNITCTSNSSQMRVAALMVANWLGWTPLKGWDEVVGLGFQVNSLQKILWHCDMHNYTEW